MVDNDHIEDDAAEKPLDGHDSAVDDAEDRPDEAAQAEPAVHDPLVNVLLATALSLVVVVLGTALVAFLYFTNLNRTPRTVVERDVTAWETAVRERPGDVNAWGSLAYAYAEAERYDDALATLTRAKRVNKEPAFVIVEADVLRLAGRNREAVASYAAAEKAVTQLRDEAAKARKKIGVTYEPEDDSLMRVFYGRALALRALGENEQAVTYMKQALKENPEAASIAIDLGELYLKLGDKPQAAKAFKQALTYIPDSKQALAGLAKAEAETR